MKIWITAPFQELYLEKLKKDNEVCYENWFDTGIIREGKELAKLLNEKGTEIFVTEEDVVQKEVFEQCPTLKMLVVCRAGTSNIDLDAAKRNNVIVVNTPGRNAVGVAEMVVGMMISVSRNFYKGEKINDLPDNERAKKGIFLSFQNPIEIPGITVSAFIRSAVEAKTGKRVRFFSFKKELEEKMELLQMDPSYAERDLNVGFSGGEKKKTEILQMLMLHPELVILDETDSGLDVDAVKTVSQGIADYRKSSKGSLLIITHSTKILESLHVDKTHIMVNGKIVKTGDSSLIDEINENGFSAYETL